MLTATSGLASKIISNTPTGHVTLYNSNPSFSLHAYVILPIGSGKLSMSVIPWGIESNLSPSIKGGQECSRRYHHDLTVQFFLLVMEIANNLAYPFINLFVYCFTLNT